MLRSLKWSRTRAGAKLVPTGLWALPLILLLLISTALPSLGEDASPSPVTDSNCASSPGIIRLDGRKVLEIRLAPGAQKLPVYIKDADARLAELARDSSFRPDQIVLKEDPLTP